MLRRAPRLAGRPPPIAAFLDPQAETRRRRAILNSNRLTPRLRTDETVHKDNVRAAQWRIAQTEIPQVFEFLTSLIKAKFAVDINIEFPPKPDPPPRKQRAANGRTAAQNRAQDLRRKALVNARLRAWRDRIKSKLCCVTKAIYSRTWHEACLYIPELCSPQTTHNIDLLSAGAYDLTKNEGQQVQMDEGQRRQLRENLVIDMGVFNDMYNDYCLNV